MPPLDLPPAARMRPVALVVKYDNYGFATELEDLDLSSFFSLLAVPEQHLAAVTQAQRSRFDQVLPLKAAKSNTDPSLLGNLQAWDLPELQAVLEELLRWVPPENLHVIGLEEELVRALATLRARFRLPGLRPQEVARFVDKDEMKAHFRTSGIATPVSAQACPADGVSALLASTAELRFPLFAKPVDGVAGAAASRLADRGALQAWAEERADQARPYLIEEFIEGTELFAYGLVQAGRLDLLSVDEMHLPMFEAVAAGEPIAEKSLTRSSPLFARVRALVTEVATALAPLPAGCFTVQLMHGHRDDVLYVMEVSARVPGDIAPRTIAWATGLNVESAHIRLQLPDAPEVPVPATQQAVATLLLPRPGGTVRGFRPLPGLHPQTKFAFDRLVEVGESLPAPQTYDDVAGRVQLSNPDPEALAEDWRRVLRFVPVVTARITGADLVAGSVHLELEDGARRALRLPLIWLRDHCLCPSCLHPLTRQRQVDTRHLPEAPPAWFEADEGELRVMWTEEDHLSRFPVSWLAGLDQAAPAPALRRWRRTTLEQDLPTVAYGPVMGGEHGLRRLLSRLRQDGLCFVSKVPVSTEATRALAERVAYLRNSIFGGFWEFTSDFAHADTAYSNLAIGPHTDGTYSLDAPGAQMFHCLRFEGSGGASTFVDGFHLAATLREQHPWAFRVLSETPVTGHYLDPTQGIHLSATRPLIRLDAEGQVVQISFNSLDRAPFLASEDRIRELYRAWRLWTDLAHDPELVFRLRLEPGTVVIFDNWRILHGREAFTGQRRLCGAYLNQEDVQSRLRGLQPRSTAAY